MTYQEQICSYIFIDAQGQVFTTGRGKRKVFAYLKKVDNRYLILLNKNLIETSLDFEKKGSALSSPALDVTAIVKDTLLLKSILWGIYGSVSRDALTGNIKNERLERAAQIFG